MHNHLLFYNKDDDSKVLYTFNYDDSSISYSDYNTQFEPTKERFNYDFNLFIMNTLFDLTGHNILYLKQNEQMLQDYDKYGITFKKEDYSFEINESGVNDTSEAVIIRDLKFTLDSEKIDTLYKDFGPIPLIFVPSIRPKKTTENSVTITVNSNYEKNETEDKLKYLVYRSKDNENNFELIFEKLYTYKDNKEEKTNKTIETTKDGRKNLETGAKLPTTIMLLVLISVVIFKNKLSKKSLFKRL